MFVTFDIETTEDMKQPICAAIAWVEGDQLRQSVYYGNEREPMSKDAIKLMLDELKAYADDGRTIVTWNGLQFDFKVIHNALSGLTEYQRRVADLASKHIDLMYYVFCCKGWPVSQQSACDGSGIKGKVKLVKLSDGREIDDMSGAMAPMLWDAGECKAVLEYLVGDVHSLLNLTYCWKQLHQARWLSKSGKHQFLDIDLDPDSPDLPTVEFCSALPQPDTSWMDRPLKRESFYDWMK